MGRGDGVRYLAMEGDTMAYTSFLPVREAELVTWSLNWKTRITATPTTFGLTAAQATAYGTLHDEFVEAYNACNSDATNSRSATITKRACKAALIAEARRLAAIVQAFPDTTDTMRSDLGLTVRDAEPSPIPAPGRAPNILVKSTDQNTVHIRLVDPAEPTRRGKPDGVEGIAVFSFVGDEAPSTTAGWKFEGNTTRTAFDVTFPASTTPGARVWFTAFYFNPRAQSGPAAAPVGTNLPGGAAMAA
jgi:hypothetical protein